MFWQTLVPPQSIVLFGGVHLSWYGLCISLALLAGASFLFWSIAHVHSTDLFFQSKKFDTLIVSIIFGGIVGARLLFVLYHVSYFLEHPSEIIAVWNGGWVWHGGIIGGIAAASIFWHRVKFPLGIFADLVAPCLALAQGIGRWGNYFNQENYGISTDRWFGIFIEESRRIPGFENVSLFHPVFFYEFVLNIILFSILFIFVKRMYASQNYFNRKGIIFLSYLMVYSIIRFFLEFIRIDEVPYLLGLRAPQWISLGIIIATLIIFKIKWLNKYILGLLITCCIFSGSTQVALSQSNPVLLNVPFVSQAPTVKWSNPIFQNACEEASLIMAFQWVQGENALKKNEADRHIRKLSYAIKKKYGTYYDSSAADTAQFAKEYFNYDSIIVRYNIRARDIINELKKGNLVITPVNGQKLKNPNFKQPGPLQHMLVIKGYDPIRKEFITNDPGTRKGDGYRYPQTRFMNAIRDYPTGNHKPITTKRKAIIIISKR